MESLPHSCSGLFKTFGNLATLLQRTFQVLETLPQSCRRLSKRMATLPQACSKLLQADKMFLQFAARQCSPTMFPCSLQRGSVPRQCPPAVCSKAVFANIVPLQPAGKCCLRTICYCKVAARLSNFSPTLFAEYF